MHDEKYGENNTSHAQIVSHIKDLAFNSCLQKLQTRIQLLFRVLLRY